MVAIEAFVKELTKEGLLSWQKICLEGWNRMVAMSENSRSDYEVQGWHSCPSSWPHELPATEGSCDEKALYKLVSQS